MFQTLLLSALTNGLLFFVAAAVLWKGGKSVDTTWVLALIGGALGFHLLIASRMTRRIPASIWWLGLLFVLWTALSYLFTSTINYGLDEVLRTTSLFLIFLWVTSFDSDKLRIRFAKVLSLATLLAAGLGVLVYLYQPISRFVGSFFDYRFHTDYWPNAWAEYLLLAWPILLWTLLRNSRHPKWMMALLFGCIFSAGFLSYSRGALISFLVQIALLALFFLWKKPGSVRIPRVSLVGVISAVIAVSFALSMNAVREKTFYVESVADKVTFTAAEGTSSISERASFWQQSMKLMNEKPLVGYGPYSFRFVQPWIQTEVLATSDHPHNVLLKFGLERGVPAMIFFLWMLGLIGWHTVMKRQQSWFTLLAGISVAGVLAHNMIDYNLQFVGIALPFWILLAFLCPKEKDHVPLWKPTLIGALSILLLIVTIREGYGLYQSSKARSAWAEQEGVAALHHFRETEWALFSRDDWLTRSIIALSSKQYINAESFAQQYILFNPTDSRGFRLLGDIYLAWNQPGEALRAYEKAFTRSSRNDLGIARGYATLLRQEPIKLELMKPVFDDLVRDFSHAIQVNAHFVALSKNVEELEELSILLSREFPETRDWYEDTVRPALEHAARERALYRARPAGLLW